MNFIYSINSNLKKINKIKREFFFFKNINSIQNIFLYNMSTDFFLKLMIYYFLKYMFLKNNKSLILKKNIILKLFYDYTKPTNK